MNVAQELLEMHVLQPAADLLNRELWGGTQRSVFGPCVFKLEKHCLQEYAAGTQRLCGMQDSSRTSQNL